MSENETDSQNGSVVSVRTATEHDLKIIDDIYNYYVLNTTSTYQEELETIDNRLKWFRQHVSDNLYISVAEIGDIIVGWGSLNMYAKRSAYRYTVENSVYIDHNYQKRGIGSVIMEDLIKKAKLFGFRTIIAKIDSEQQPSVRFHEKFGFSRVGYLCDVGFKFNRWLSVVVLQLTIN